VYTEHFEICAAIGSAGTARNAAPAVEIGLDRAAVAGLESIRLAAWVENLDAKLVTEDAWVLEKGLLPGKGVKVCAAHADAMHPYQGLTRSRSGRGAFGRDETAGLFKGYLDHERTR
jgi:hypothetical protein